MTIQIIFRVASAYVIDLSQPTPLWTIVAPLPSARTNLACGGSVLDDGQNVVVIAGGTDVNGTKLDEVLIYNPSANNYTQAAS